MFERESGRPKRIARERLVYRYSNALERGDFATVAAILEGAADDPVLQALIRELNDAAVFELQLEQDRGRSNHKPGANDMSTFNRLRFDQVLPRPRAVRSYGYLPLALAALLAIVFSALLIVNASQNGSFNFAGLFQSQENENIEVFQRYISEAWNAGDVLVLSELLTDDHIRNASGFPNTTGIEPVSEFIVGTRSAFPDFQSTIVDIGADGDRVWARTVNSGTHRGPLRLPGGIEFGPSGNAFAFESISIARFTDGKIAEIWVTDDGIGLLQQLNIVPPASTLSGELGNTELAQEVVSLLNMDELPSPEVVGQLYVDEWLLHLPTRTFRTSPEGWRDILFEIKNGIPDFEATIENIVAQNDTVIVHYTAQGTHEGRMASPRGNVLQPSGERVEWDGVFIYRVKDGQIEEEWWYWDNALIGAVDYRN